MPAEAHLAKIRADSALVSDDRERLLSELEAQTTDAEKAAHFNEVCQQRRLRGPEPNPPLNPKEVLGRIAYKQAFARRISHALAGKNHMADEKAIDDMLTSLFEAGDYEEEDLEFFFRELAGDLQLSLANVLSASDSIKHKLSWLFRNPEFCDQCSLTGFEASELPYRLGLPLVSDGSQYIAFEVQAEILDNPRQPTVQDCDWDQLLIFEPGGKTLPTGGYPSNCGLLELVVHAPRFRFLYGMPVGIVAGPPKETGGG